MAWGNEGHTYINRVAAQKMPAEMPRFLRRAVAEIAYLGPEPDRWRNPSELQLKNAQEPDHFIDLERVDWLNPLPATRYEFYRKLYEKRAATTDRPDDYLPEHVGLQPYITLEIFGRLKAAFREYRRLRELTSTYWRRWSTPSCFMPDGSVITWPMAPSLCTPPFNTTAGWDRILTDIRRSTEFMLFLKLLTWHRMLRPRIFLTWFVPRSA